MVVVTLSGGAGNQLRLYACAYTVAEYLNQPLVLDVCGHFGGVARPYVLDLLAIPNHLKIYYASLHDIPFEFRKKFECIINIEEFKNRSELIQAVKGKKNVWITGQSAVVFFLEVERNILRNFLQPEIKSSCLTFLISKLEDRSVAVHVRRTDFLALQWTNDETLEYYKAAITFLNQKIEGLKFYIFSDDMEWVKRNLGYNENYYYVHFFGGMKTDIEELYCMSLCKHHILTKYSSFGEWSILLSPYEDGINITNEETSDIPRLFVMNEQMIENYCDSYKADYKMEIKEIPWNILEQRLEANDNNTVIDYIAKLSCDTYGISAKMHKRLMELYGIAHAQNGDVNTAVSVFDCLQQTERDSYDFSFNYSIVLEKEGHHLESLIYMGNAWRMNKNIVPGQFLPIRGILEQDILKLVSRQKHRHYIFLDPPNLYANNIHGYYESIGIMLRNVGNTVTILEIVDDSPTFLSELNKDEKSVIVKTMQSFVKGLDRVYDFGVNRYTFCELKTSGISVFTIDDFLPYIIHEKDNVVFITHSIEGARTSSNRYPLIFFDTISGWDNERPGLNDYNYEERQEIFQCSNKIITKRNLPTEWNSKIVKPFNCMQETSSNEIYLIKEKIKELCHYMRNDECLNGMLSILKAVTF